MLPGGNRILDTFVTVELLSFSIIILGVIFTSESNVSKTHCVCSIGSNEKMYKLALI